jgi:hypothetical protein
MYLRLPFRTDLKIFSLRMKFPQQGVNIGPEIQKSGRFREFQSVA